MATQYSYIFQDRGHAIRDVKTGKMFPYKTKSLTSGTELSPGPNKRFFIKSAHISYETLAADTGTELTLSGKINLETNTLVKMVKTTQIVNNSTNQFQIGILLDKEATIMFSADNITTKSCIITIAEVDDNA